MVNPAKKRVVIAAGCVVVLTICLIGALNRERLLGWYRIWQVLGRDFDDEGRNAQGYREYRHRESGILFVFLSGGTFLMGGANGAFADEQPRHRVTLSPFLIAKYEITQSEWQRIMGRNPARFNRSGDQPVDTISWSDCEALCRKTGLALPTEAQWEFACRAGSSGRFSGPLGDANRVDDLGWYRDNSSGTTQPVGRKEPNRFGLHDMHGNVREYCADRYDFYFYGKPEASGTDPLCESTSNKPVVRGGSWNDSAMDCRSTARRSYGSLRRGSYSNGFRPAFRFP